MRSLLGRFHRPFARGTEEQLLMLNNLGDGSTLSLDFTTGVLDPRLTFTRTSNATFINSSGLVEWAAANILVRSNELSNTGSWSRTGIVAPTTSSSAPTGDAAWRLEESAGVAGTHSLAQSPASSQGIPYTFSILVKKDQRNWIVIQIASATFVYFDANAGVFGTTSGTLIGYDKSDVGDGWWRIYISANALASSLSCVVYLASANGTVSYTGVSGQGLFIASPQIEPGVVMRSYNQTGSAAYQAPRFDHDPTAIGTPRGLLIEGSSINYMLESTSLSGYSNSNMVAVTSGTETDPEGNANSAKQIYASATTGYHGWYRTVTAGTNTTVTVSIWAKARNYTFLFLSDLASGRAAVRFNLQTGATDNNFGAGYVSAKATQYTNGWWRCEMTASVTASTGYGWAIAGIPTSGATLNGFGAQYTGTGNAADGIYCYGFQVEAGSGASSYIPTGASTGTRNADSLVIQDGAWRNTANIDSTWYVDGALNKMNTAFNSVFDVVGNVGFTERNRIFISATGSQVRFTHYARSASVNPDFEYAINQASPNGYVYGSRFKVAATFDNTAGENRSSWNGATSNGTTAAACTTTPTYFTITVGSGNDWHYRSIKYWPFSLPQAQINSITTI